MDEEQQLKIKQVVIQNFRGITTKETFELDNLNILIGENGLCKTTILEAIHYAFNPTYAQSHITYDDFTNGSDNPIIIEIYFNNDIPVKFQYGFQYKTILFDKIGLHISKRNSNKGLKKSLNSGFVFHHYLLPKNQEKSEKGWNVKDTNGDRQTLTLLQAREALNEIPIKCSYFNTDREKQIVKGYNTSLSSVFDDFNWRFLKNLDEENKGLYNQLKIDLEQFISSHIDENIQEKTLSSINSKLKSNFNLPTIDISLFGKDAPFNSAFLSNKSIGTDLPISKLGSGIEMITSIVLLETLANLSKNNLILLIDEPELHLHPALQKKLLEYMKDISKNTQIIFTTHSPYMFKDCENKKNIKLIYRGNVEKNKTLFPWGQTWGQINYFLYHLPTIEFFNELYGYLQEKFNLKTSVNVDNFLLNYNVQIDREWKRYDKDKIKIERHTFVSYIRNIIHHPENKLNTQYTEEELKQAIEVIIPLLLEEQKQG